MKATTLIVTLLVSLSAYGQSSPPEEDKDLSIGIHFSPDFCYRDLQYKSSNSPAAELRDDEVPKFGFTTGISLQRQVFHRFYIQTGLFYSDKGEKEKAMTLAWVTPDPAYPVRSQTVFQFQFLEAPLKGILFLSSKRLKYYVTGGISAGVFLARRTKVKLTYADGHTDNSTSSHSLGYNRFNLSVLLGLGLNYTLSQRLSVSLEPLYRRSLTSINVDENAAEYLYSFGMNTGLIYTFE